MKSLSQPPIFYACSCDCHLTHPGHTNSDADHYVEVCAPRAIDAATIGAWMSRVKPPRNSASSSSLSVPSSAASSASVSGVDAADISTDTTTHHSSGRIGTDIVVNHAHLRVAGVVEHLCTLFPLPAHLIATVAAHLGTVADFLMMRAQSCQRSHTS